MLTLLLLSNLACNLSSGEAVNIEATVVEVGGGSITLDHGGTEGLPSTLRTFPIDPNLARRVERGSEVTANVIIGENPQVIGVEPR